MNCRFIGFHPKNILLLNLMPLQLKWLIFFKVKIEELQWILLGLKYQINSIHLNVCSALKANLIRRQRRISNEKKKEGKQETNKSNTIFVNWNAFF